MLSGLLKNGEVYLFEVAIVLGDAHLANAPLFSDLAVLQYVLHGHRTVAVAYDVQVVVDQGYSPEVATLDPLIL